MQSWNVSVQPLKPKPKRKNRQIMGPPPPQLHILCNPSLHPLAPIQRQPKMSVSWHHNGPPSPPTSSSSLIQCVLISLVHISCSHSSRFSHTQPNYICCNITSHLLVVDIPSSFERIHILLRRIAIFSLPFLCTYIQYCILSPPCTMYPYIKVLAPTDVCKWYPWQICGGKVFLFTCLNTRLCLCHKISRYTICAIMRDHHHANHMSCNPFLTLFLTKHACHCPLEPLHVLLVISVSSLQQVWKPKTSIAWSPLHWQYLTKEGITCLL